jgi:hypothetical protein
MRLAAKAKIKVLEKDIESILDRIVSANNPKVIAH